MKDQESVATDIQFNISDNVSCTSVGCDDTGGSEVKLQEGSIKVIQSNVSINVMAISSKLGMRKPIPNIQNFIAKQLHPCVGGVK